MIIKLALSCVHLNYYFRQKKLQVSVSVTAAIYFGFIFYSDTVQACRLVILV